MIGIMSNVSEIHTVSARLLSPDIVTRVIQTLTPDQIAYAADPARGEYRGYAALDDLMDNGQLLLDCGCPAPDGTQATMDSISAIASAVSNAIVTKAEGKA